MSNTFYLVKIRQNDISTITKENCLVFMKNQKKERDKVTFFLLKCSPPVLMCGGFSHPLIFVVSCCDDKVNIGTVLFSLQSISVHCAFILKNETVVEVRYPILGTNLIIVL